MGKRKNKLVSKRTRLSLDLPDKTKELIDAVQIKSNRPSITAAVTFSVTLADTLLTAQQSGCRVQLKSTDGSVETLSLL